MSGHFIIKRFPLRSENKFVLLKIFLYKSGDFLFVIRIFM